MPQSRPKRVYRLSPERRESLRAAAARNRPWLNATGPKTTAGKSVSRFNARKHGQRDAKARAGAAIRGALNELERAGSFSWTRVPGASRCQDSAKTKCAPLREAAFARASRAVSLSNQAIVIYDSLRR